MLAWHLASRYLRRRRMAWLAIGAVTLTVAVSVAVLGIMDGWVDMTERQVRAAESDITLKDLSDGMPVGFGIDEHLETITGVAATAPYITTPAAMITESGKRRDGRRMVPVNVEGLDWKADRQIGRLRDEWLHARPGLNLSAPPLEPEERGTGFVTQQCRAWMALAGADLAGAFVGAPLPTLPAYSYRPFRPGFIAGRELLYEQQWYTEVGEQVSLSLPNGKGGTLGKARGEISDTIGTGIIEIDRYAMLVPLNHAQELTALDQKNDQPARIDGYRIRINDGADAATVRSRIAADPILKTMPLGASLWQETRGNIVALLVANKRNLMLVMILIQALCIFTVAAVFSTLVAEKRHDIGVLLGFGATRGSIVCTFLIAATVACVSGGLIGWGLGWGALSLINPLSEFFGVPLFPQEVIYTSEAPIAYDPQTPLIFIGTQAIIGLLAAAWPAWRASRINPVDTIREQG